MSNPASRRPPPVFTPVPVRARRDGWTVLRQARFIFELATTRCVDEACRRVGLSQQSAYKLRDRPDAASFRAAWEAALGRPPLPDDFTGRALGGTATPIAYRGRTIGERRRYDNRLAMFLVQVHGRDRGRWQGEGENDEWEATCRGDVDGVWPTFTRSWSGEGIRR